MNGMNMADKIAKAVLYEGYLLYPYTPHATKNRQRWTFGGLYPRKYVERRPGADSSELRSEILIEEDRGARITIRLRFLHLISRASLDDQWNEWEEAVEIEKVFGSFALGDLARDPYLHDFEIPKSSPAESQDELSRVCELLCGRIEASAERIGEKLFKLKVIIRNRSEKDTGDRKEALLHSFVSTHLVFSAIRGKFVSMFDPPEKYQEFYAQCKNVGTWPILLGEPGEREMMLSSPIILYDHPQIAPESPGDLFDGGEIDEILSLRILTLTDQEKERIRATDERGRAMLERTERLTQEELLQMHGAWRDSQGRPQSARLGDRVFKPGCRVRIRPKRISDVFDILLTGMTATVQSIEQNLEGQYLICVAMDDDPGRDIESKAQLGHRFFFKPEDLEIL